MENFFYFVYHTMPVSFHCIYLIKKNWMNRQKRFTQYHYRQVQYYSNVVFPVIASTIFVSNSFDNSGLSTISLRTVSRPCPNFVSP